jgi:hypothetical protein
MNGLIFEEKTAVISDDGLYRYDLTRQWAPSPEKLTFIMLNPSSADADVDDPTIRRCIGFAKREGLAGIRVVNLFAFRASKPSALIAHPEPAGPENHGRIMAAIWDAADAGTPVVAAWGAWFHSHPGISKSPNVREMVNLATIPLFCLGVTAAGHPRHPLYVKGDQPLREWTSTS